MLLQVCMDGIGGLVNVIDAAVGFLFQFVEDVGVENKDGQDGRSRRQGVVQSGIVFETQVAAKPEDG